MGGISFVIPGTPVPQARARHRVVKLRSGQTFVGQYDPAESRIWKATVAEFAAQAMAGTPPLEGPLSLAATFVFTPPASTRKRDLTEIAGGMELPKFTKPDLDNLLKGCTDGMKGIVYRDDGQLWRFHTEKVYGMRAEVRVVVAPALAEAATPPHQPAQLALA